MIDERIIEGLREYLKDHFIPEISAYHDFSDDFSLSDECCIDASSSTSRRKNENKEALLYPTLETECKAVGAASSLRDISDEASTFIKKHRKPGSFAHSLDGKRTEKGLSPAELYKRANIDRRQYSRFMGPEGRHPSMNTVISFALALELKRQDFDELLQTAGYALNNTSSRDVCIMYCLEKCIYSIDDVNALLFAIGLDPLSRE